MSFGGAAKCPRCGKAVYFAEQALGPGGIKYHKLCFRCNTCGKSLDSMTMAEKDNVLFCKTCYGKEHGPKGYGYGGGAGTLTQTGQYTDAVDAKAEPVRFGASSSAPAVPARDAPRENAQVSSVSHTTVSRFGGGGMPRAGGGVQIGGAPKCPRCGKSVYAAEQAMGPNSQPYHKICLRCTKCGKAVDSMTMAEHEGELYCKACYGKEHGPKGYGYGGGAGTLTHTS